MAFAPYSNDRLPGDENPIIGCFFERDYGRLFEYTDAVNPPFDGYRNVIFVGFGERRYARVLKTVAYIVTDVDDDGEPIVEKWRIKDHKQYDLSPVWAKWERERQSAGT